MPRTDLPAIDLTAIDLTAIDLIVSWDYSESWPFAVLALIVGCALGPALDSLARRSLGEIASADDEWRRRPSTTGVVAGVSAAAVVLLVPEPALAPAWVVLALVGASIVRTDIAVHRIPDVLTAAAALAGAVLLLLPGDLAAYGRAWLAALALAAAFLGLGLLGSTGLGMGDVKLAPALGLYLGFLGWTELIFGVLAGFVIAAVAGLALVARDALLRRSIGSALRRPVPFGPFLLAGCVAGLAIA